MEHLFHDKHQDTKTENEYWTFSMVMFFEAMCKGIKPNSRSEQDHEIFEKLIVYHISTEQRQTSKHERQYCTVNSAYDGCRNAQCVKIHPHIDVKVPICNKVAKKHVDVRSPKEVVILKHHSSWERKPGYISVCSR